MTHVDQKAESNGTWLNAIAGAALGALIALLIALSSTAVVSATLTVLVAAAVVFLALQDKLSPERESSMTPALLWRIIGFSVSGIAALLIGLSLRASNAFGDSETVRLYGDLVSIGMDEVDARKIAAGRVIGTSATPETEAERQTRSTTLFSNGASAASCSNMTPSDFNDVASLIARYSAEGGDWTYIANTVSVAIRSDPNLNGMEIAKGLYAAYCAERK